MKSFKRSPGRDQLPIDLRSLDVPVPEIWNRSADENPSSSQTELT
jgi:hypothetical protein